MRKILALVEGQTEELFVRDVLDPHLRGFDACVVPVILKTKRVKSGGTFRGGVTGSAQVLSDLRRLMGDTSAAMITTILDYYGLPDDFPGMSSRPPRDPYQRVGAVEAALQDRIDDRRFVPHLVLHEYEAWLYTDPTRCDWVFDQAGLPQRLIEIRDACGGAERIDEGAQSAPSRRLIGEFPGYRKALHGPLAVGAMGLSAVRAACPHLEAWLRRLESA